MFSLLQYLGSNGARAYLSFRIYRIDGANMPRRPHTTVRRDANRRSSKGEISLILRAPINAIGRIKPRAYKEQ